MTDCELLELAAKAAGLQVEPCANGWDERWPLGWNPLNDDGDALRLAVRLRILVQTDICFAEVPHEKQCKVIRRAIVHAAAEIGKTL